MTKGKVWEDLKGTVQSIFKFGSHRLKSNSGNAAIETIAGESLLELSPSVYKVLGKNFYKGTGTPTLGAYVETDFIWNESPGDSGVIGWYCSSSGSPGTWREIVASFQNSNLTDFSLSLNKLQQINQKELLGRYSAFNGTVQRITIGSGLNLGLDGILSANETNLNNTIYLDGLIDVQITGLNTLTGTVLLGYDFSINKWKPTNISTIVSINGKSTSIVNLTTQDVPETAGYLYYSDSRVSNRVNQLSIDTLADVNKTGWAVNKVWGFDSSGNTVPLNMAAIGGIGFRDLIDGNLGTPINGQSIVYNSSTQKFTMGSIVTINSTDDLAQGNRSDRRYYSDYYVNTWISSQSISIFGDVNTYSSQNGQVLKKINGVWQGADVVLPSTTDDLPQGNRGDRLYYSDNYVTNWAAYRSIDLFGDVDRSGWTTGKVLGFRSDGTLVPINADTSFDSRIAQTNISALLNVGERVALGGYALIYDAATNLWQPGPTGTISINLTYQYAGDDRGLVYWCGSEKRNQTFVNPGLKSSPWNITVTLSSNLSSDLTSFAIDRNNSTLIHTASQVNSRCTLDLGTDKLIKPNFYSLRGRSDSNTNHPRTWKIQGSSDAQNWVDLDVQVNNGSVYQNSYFATSCTATESYRYLSIVQAGSNSSGADFLVFSEIEFYGLVTLSGTSTASNTDELEEGTLNLYYKDSRVASYLNSAVNVISTRAVRGLSGVNTGDQDLSGLSTITSLTNAITSLVGTAPTDGNTLGKLYNLISALSALTGGSTADGDSIVNTVSEVLAAFANYPEGVNILNALAAKVNISDIANNLTQGTSGKVLDATQGRILKELVDNLSQASTPAQIAASLNALMDTERVDYNALKNRPAGSTGAAGGDLTGTYPNPAIAANAISFAKIQQIASGSLLGRSTGGTGNTEAIAIGGGLTLTNGILSSQTGVTFASNTEILTGSKTLLSSSPFFQILDPNGSDRNVTLNSAWAGLITNDSTGTYALNLINGSNLEVSFSAASNIKCAWVWFSGSEVVVLPLAKFQEQSTSSSTGLTKAQNVRLKLLARGGI